jgi:hypothetical protein
VISRPGGVPSVTAKPASANPAKYQPPTQLEK